MARNVAILILRGVKANMPTLSVGESYFCTDTFEWFTGSSGGNMPVTIPVYNAAGTKQNKPHMIVDRATLPTSGTLTVTLAGSAPFTSATSYACHTQCTNAKHTIVVAQNSGSSITFTGAGGDAFTYTCIGT